MTDYFHSGVWVYITGQYVLKIVSSSIRVFESTLDKKMAWGTLLLASLLSFASADHHEWDYSKHSSTDLFNLLLFTIRVELYRHKLDC